MKKRVIASTILLTILLCGCSTKTVSGPVNSQGSSNHKEESTLGSTIQTAEDIAQTTGETPQATEDTSQTTVTAVETNERPVYEIGDLVEYGTYEQDGDESNGEEPIIWRVLDKNESAYLLLSENIIEVAEFKHNEGSSPWNYCNLRDWLNKRFYNDHLYDDKRFSIKETEITNLGSIEYYSKYNRGVDKTPNTTDKVFLLSLEDIESDYFSGTSGWEEDPSRVAYATEYVKNRVNEIKESGESLIDRATDQLDIDGSLYWWLRTGGAQDDTTLGVLPTGELEDYGSRMEYAGVRPAVWAYAH